MKLIWTQDFRDFVASLNRNEVKYVLLGGYAVGWHGAPRATKDVDFFIERSAENVRRTIRAVEEFGLSCLGFTEADLTEENSGVFFGTPPYRVDIINFAQGITFEEAWATRIVDDSEGMTLNVISRDLLIQNKQSTGRPQDQVDAAVLLRRVPKLPKSRQ